jgi:hypothetical protein
MKAGTLGFRGSAEGLRVGFQDSRPKVDTRGFLVKVDLAGSLVREVAQQVDIRGLALNLDTAGSRGIAPVRGTAGSLVKVDIRGSVVARGTLDFRLTRDFAEHLGLAGTAADQVTLDFLGTVGYLGSRGFPPRVLGVRDSLGSVGDLGTRVTVVFQDTPGSVENPDTRDSVELARADIPGSADILGLESLLQGG